uniref:Uncharacterized protein n=1 Tax=Rhizophora mucronata TaxID=61149 RepID=A0A2P2QWK5_RHIMU
MQFSNLHLMHAQQNRDTKLECYNKETIAKITQAELMH